MSRGVKSRNLLFRLAMLLIILLLAGAIIYIASYASKGNQINITDSYIEITGIRGEKIEYKDIQSAELKDSFPGVEQRLMGSEIGSTKRGSFVVKDLGKCILLMDTGIDEYIYIKAADGYHIVNYGDADKTSGIFDKLKSKLQEFKK